MHMLVREMDHMFHLDSAAEADAEVAALVGPAEPPAVRIRARKSETPE
jgi:hypothetical protein